MRPPDPSAVLARLPGEVPAVAVRAGGTWIVGVAPIDERRAGGSEAFDVLDDLPAGWWAGYLGYGLGHAVERVTTSWPDDRVLPDLALMRFDVRLVLDDNTATAWIDGDGRGRAMLEAAVRDPSPSIGGPGCDRWHSSLGRHDFEARVDEARRLIHAGECYQVNLTRRLTCETAADPVALFGALARHNPSPHLSLLRFEDHAVVSASPERFLRWNDRFVETRPIKGTHAKPGPLQDSLKDRAENVMIVDLARNDLGRICEFGSVVTPALCALESHPGLHHLVSTVRGQLRGDVGPSELVRATFPPASVTGAPKPRVLQAIADLEPVPRGVYCGAVGWLDTQRGKGDLAVAIRTFTVTPSGTDLGVGSGIVADSSPAAEWEETELKARRLLEAARIPIAATVD
jgi:para-aminobenzoate synthetase component I